MHDAFLSYNRVDRAWAQRIRDLLAGNGISTFFDEELTPGRLWHPELEGELRECPATIVLWGKGGLGNTQQLELQLAMVLQRQDDTRLVVPVLLEGKAE